MARKGWIAECEDLARQVRCQCLRMTHRGRSGHVPMSLGSRDLKSSASVRKSNFGTAGILGMFGFFMLSCPAWKAALRAPASHPSQPQPL